MRMLLMRLMPPAAVLGLALVTTCVRAQDNPFDTGGDAEPAADNPFGPAAEPAASPFGPAGGDMPGDEPGPAPAAAPAAGTAEPAADEAPHVPRDPAVEAVLESNPQTPFELLRAIRILADLGYPKLAQPYVDQLIGKQLTVEEQAALFRQFPSAMLMRVARDPALAAKLGPFIDQLFQAAEAMRRDPARLDQWTKMLGDPSETVRAQATLALVRARDAAVAPLLAVLADPALAGQHAMARRILIRLGKDAAGPLVAALDSPDVALKTQVVEVLGAMQARDAVSSLLIPLVAPDTPHALRAMTAAAIAHISGRTPDTAEAFSLLEHAARHELGLSRDERGDGEPTIEVWHWDDQLKQSVPALYNQTGAHLATAVRLAAQLHELDPESAERRRLYLTALLQAAKLAGGLDNPLPAGEGTPYAQAASFGPHVIEDVLAGAMAEGYTPAATAAAQILGDIGSVDLVTHGAGTPSTLVEAAHDRDRRLRFAATAAIMKLDPREPFAGSSYVTQSLGFFANSYGYPRILIAHPLSAEGGKLAGLAAALGFEGDAATTGRQAYELAVASPDYEVILIHSAISRPAVDELVAQLRRDTRTARIPIGLIAPLNDLDRIQRYARRAGEAEAFLQPQNEPEMKLFVGDLLARAGRSHVSVERRREQALAALDWMLALSESHQRVFDIVQLESMLVPLMYFGETAGKAIELLSEIGTEPAQEALVQLADSPVQSLPVRKAAVTALARSIRRHGILLTSDEIRAQYDFYNDNAGRNPESHEVLGALLDVIEYQGDPPQATTASGP